MIKESQKSKVKSQNFAIYLLIFIFLITLVCFTVYTYSQVDLNLTLSTNFYYQAVQQKLTYLGYFNRTISTIIFLILLIFFFLFYGYFIFVVKRKKISLRLFWQLIVISYGFLIFSYPAFSHDIFNYLFDARIVTKYGLSPYYFKALDFPNDPWTRFMRWTHRYYPYGPFWLYLTLPLSYLGLGKFVFTLGLFKLFFMMVSMGNIWLVGKLLEKINPKKKLLGMIFFAFNPLVMIESIVSPHNEVVMFFFTLSGILFLLLRRKLIGLSSLLLSVGVKFLPLIYLPIVFIKRSSLKSKKLYAALAMLTLLELIPVIHFREPYAWYFIPVIGFAAISQSWWLMTLVIGISAGTLLRYAPFLYFGSYEPPVPQLQTWFFILPIFISFLIITMMRYTRRY